MNAARNVNFFPQPEQAILDVMEVGREIALENLLKQLHDRGFEDDVENKAAIWRLIAQHKVERTSERNLLLHTQGNANGQ